MSTLAGARFEKVLSTGSPAYLYQFRNKASNQTIIAAFSSGKSIMVRLPTETSRRVVKVDEMGNRESIMVDGLVEIGEYPTYFILEQ